MNEKKETWIYNIHCPDAPGVVAKVAGLVYEVVGMIRESKEFNNSDSLEFFMRVQFDIDEMTDEIKEKFAKLSKELKGEYGLYDANKKLNTIIMVSKEAHCLNGLLFRHRAGVLNIDIKAIVGNHDDLKELAEFYGIPFHHIPVTKETKKEAEQDLRGLVKEYEADLVILARYMQILSEELCEDMHGNIINIHHSFLPSFKGARPYKQAHDRGVKMIGATAHYVTSDLDEGPIIEQEVLRVDHNADVKKLMELGRDTEVLALSQAVLLHAEHRVLLDGHRTVVF
ncbi:MAG: formyltetrahydrofolate deformylase [Micrococcaceae bacterium]